MAHSTASRLVKRARDAGAVDQVVSSRDRRAATVRASERGEELGRWAVQFRLAHLAQIVSTWAPQDIATFARLLDTFAGIAGHLPRRVVAGEPPTP